MKKKQSRRILLLGVFLVCSCTGMISGLCLIVLHTPEQKAVQHFMIAQESLALSHKAPRASSEEKTLQTLVQTHILQALALDPFEARYWAFYKSFARKRGSLSKAHAANILYEHLYIPPAQTP